MFLSDIDRDDLDMDISTSDTVTYTAAELQAVDHDVHSESDQSTTGRIIPYKLININNYICYICMYIHTYIAYNVYVMYN